MHLRCDLKCQGEELDLELSTPALPLFRQLRLLQLRLTEVNQKSKKTIVIRRLTALILHVLCAGKRGVSMVLDKYFHQEPAIQI